MKAVTMTDYAKFYGFTENPFDASPDPKFFFPSESHNEALASLRYGIDNRKGIILILGEAGIGKTTLIHHLIGTLDAKVKTVLFPQSQIPFEQMLKDMLLKLELPLGSENKGSMLHELYYYLIRCREQNENVAIIIDEAENIGLDVIEEVRLLANLETSTSKLLQIVLVGQPKLREKLRSDVIRQIKQRIVVSCEITPLTQEESAQYIDHRLKIAGSGCSEVFTDEALSLICQYAKGIPLALNILCSNALAVGYGFAEKRISPSTVRIVRGEKNILSRERTEILVTQVKRYLPQKISSVILTVVVFAMVLFFSWNYVQPIFNPQHPDHSVPPRTVSDSASPPPLEVKQPGVDATVPGSSDQRVVEVPPEPPQIPPSPATTAGRSDTEIRIKEIIEVKKGANLYSLAYKYHKEMNETFIDHILKLNPEITNPHLIRVDQRIKIPEITDSLLIVRYSANSYKVHLKTFANFKNAEKYRSGVTLSGKDIEIVPLKVSVGETWYRVMAGPFGTWTEGSKVIEGLNLQ
jgi:general secretion pathway protein A